MDYDNPIVAVRFERAVRDRLKDLARRRGTNLSALIREQVLRHLADVERWAESTAVSPRNDGMEA